MYLDIAKAFDSVDRQFIFQAMAIMGASAGMLAWARLMLADTRASVHANGVESAPLLWQAGVRQGCPLSPLLYLFVGQALTSWLRAQPELGVEVDGRRHVCSMYADDTSALIGLSAAAAACLLAAMEKFRKASGQAVNARNQTSDHRGEIALLAKPPLTKRMASPDASATHNRLPPRSSPGL